jgi:hypothetical protein
VEAAPAEQTEPEKDAHGGEQVEKAEPPAHGRRLVFLEERADALVVRGAWRAKRPFFFALKKGFPRRNGRYIVGS